FTDRGAPTVGAWIGGEAVVTDNPALHLAQVRGREELYWLLPRPRLAVELAEGYIAVVRDRDLRVPAQAREARWAVRRGLGVLRELKAAKQLHPVHARLIPFFETKLAELRDEREARLVRADGRPASGALDLAGPGPRGGGGRGRAGSASWSPPWTSWSRAVPTWIGRRSPWATAWWKRCWRRGWARLWLPRRASRPRG